jgi:A/G-specific adenine glycosylase
VAPRPDAADALRDALLRWYGANARDLPWRRTSDPYAILVSEVMLQQTQVARVVERYEAWLTRWPTAASLAAARRDDVLRAWVGLGYNRRALALHAACTIVARDGWPDDLQALPGVGPYTAAAIGAFAFGRDVVALDTNARRLFARLRIDLAPAAGQAADFNQATMELGATICTARTPRCGACPLAFGCPGPGVEVVKPRRKPQRFEDSNRFVRGRIVAALASGAPLPDVAPVRLEAALSGLERDGLVALGGSRPRLVS